MQLGNFVSLLDRHQVCAENELVAGLVAWICNPATWRHVVPVVPFNSDRSKTVLFSTVQRAKRLSAISTVDAAGYTIAVSTKIKPVGVTLDGNLNVNDQVTNACKAFLFNIR